MISVKSYSGSWLTSLGACAEAGAAVAARVIGRSKISYVGMAAWSSIGKSTTVMKSVPSPGSPDQIPSGVVSATADSGVLFSFGSAGVLFSLWAFILAWSMAINSLLSLPEPSAVNCASGISVSWLSDTGASSVGCSLLARAVAIASSSETAACSVGLSALSVWSVFSVGSSAVLSAAFIPSCCILMAAALAAAMASSSALLLRPLCLGKAASGSTVAGIACGVSPSVVVSVAAGPLTWFFITSKFSPSIPWTEYTRSSFLLAMRVRLRFCAAPSADASAKASRIV